MDLIVKIFGIWIILTGFIVCHSDDRFMCRSCQYQINMKNTECVMAPENMTTADHRLRCPGLCMTISRWKKETLLPTYMYRGCSHFEPEEEDKCIETDLEYQCHTQCEGHYCNIDWGFVSRGSKDNYLTIDGLTVCLLFSVGLL